MSYQNYLAQMRRNADWSNTRQAQKTERAMSVYKSIPMDTDTWLSDTGEAIPVRQLSDETLWKVIIWCTRYAYQLFVANDQMAAEHEIPLTAARRWLCQQQVFQAAVQEAGLRELTFPDDVYDLLDKHYLEYIHLQRPAPAERTVPWRDPAKKAQAAHLRDIAAITAVDSYGKKLRNLTIALPKESECS